MRRWCRNLNIRYRGRAHKQNFNYVNHLIKLVSASSSWRDERDMPTKTIFAFIRRGLGEMKQYLGAVLMNIPARLQRRIGTEIINYTVANFIYIQLQYCEEERYLLTGFHPRLVNKGPKDKGPDK